MPDLPLLIALLAGLAAGAIAVVALRRAEASRAASRPAAAASVVGDGSRDRPVGEAGGAKAASGAGDRGRVDSGSDEEDGPARSLIHLLAERYGGAYESLGSPGDLMRDPRFHSYCAKLAADRSLSTADLLDYYRGDQALLANLSLGTLMARDEVGLEDVLQPVLEHLNYGSYYSRCVALQLLHLKASAAAPTGPDSRPLIRAVLGRVDEDWLSLMLLRELQAWLRRRQEHGESLELNAGAAEPWSGRQLLVLEQLVAEFADDLGQPLKRELARLQEQHIDLEWLQSIGTVLAAPAAVRGPDDDHGDVAEPTGALDSDRPNNRDAGLGGGRGPVVRHQLLDLAVSTARRHLHLQPPRSVLLSGDPGTGKTTAIRLLAADLAADGLTVFQASAADLLAGQAYIGDVEQRARDLVRRLRRRPVVWILDRFHELAEAGRHRFSNTSFLDLLLPSIECGDLRVVGEIRPHGLQQLLRQVPRLASAFEVLTVPSPGADRVEMIARSWAEEHPGGKLGRPRFEPEVITEAHQLVRQYLPARRAPGNVIEFLENCWQQILTERPGEPGEVIEVTTDDLLVTMAGMSGLPLAILDERKRIDVDGLRRHFAERILGQPEAVEVLVNRVMMVKAGLTDPARPLGVFLFAGPTGTGKTQIAKTLAEYLFGSAERMIRLDMSEFQNPASIGRLVGESDGSGTGIGGGSLVERIRLQPFSVLLLDEFEKADAAVWDLFLQVFDDGRLTDHQGQAADFRNAIIILTSNLGATEARRAGLGFQGAETGPLAFRAEDVHQTLHRTFRPEFINRLDRVVVFRPLDRPTMREILRHELTGVLARRGLRNRPWVVDWAPEGLEFLLERGFSAELGARPLRRAIDEHLLTPLAAAIVGCEAPEGEQYLRITVAAARDRLAVEFIDPEAGGEGGSGAAALAVARGRLTLPGLMLSARGDVAEWEFLRQRHGELAALVELGSFAERKSAALADLGAESFWERADRYQLLGLAEYIDRIEAALSAAGDKLAQPRPGNARLQRLATRLHVIELAITEVIEDHPRDAFVLIEPLPRDRPDGEAQEFADRLMRMYQRWGEGREMKQTRLPLPTSVAQGGSLLAFSGLGAWLALEPEDGLHVLERGAGGGGGVREPVSVRVRVSSQPEVPSSVSHQSLAEQGAAAFSGGGDAEAEAPAALVRRYQEQPTPLVRDKVRDYRSGRLDLVMDGYFDVISSGE